jgi:hypothetical protein
MGFCAQKPRQKRRAIMESYCGTLFDLLFFDKESWSKAKAAHCSYPHRYKHDFAGQH